MSETDWEKRADEIWDEIAGQGFSVNGTGFCDGALRLGREMASYERGECYSELGNIETSWRERIAKARAEAADARAEEIAQRLETANLIRPGALAACEIAALIARQPAMVTP